MPKEGSCWVADRTLPAELRNGYDDSIISEALSL